MKKIILLASAVAMLSATACNKLLDLTPRDSISDKVMWADVSSAEYAVNSVYSYIYDIYVTYPCVAGMTDALTDQIKYGSYLYNSMCFIPSEIAYGGSTLTANYVDVYMGAWGSLYGALRRTNEAIYNLHTLGTNLSEADRIRLEAENGSDVSAPDSALSRYLTFLSMGGSAARVLATQFINSSNPCRVAALTGNTGYLSPMCSLSI